MMFCLTVTINKCTWNIDCYKKKKKFKIKNYVRCGSCLQYKPSLYIMCHYCVVVGQ